MRALQGTKATGPTFCWVCRNQLQRAPGKGKGLFYFALVKTQNGEQRVHNDCREQAIRDGAVAVDQPV